MDHRDEKELKAFDSALQKRTTQLFTKISSQSNNARSLDSLTQVIRCLSDTNQDVVRVILGSKGEIHGSRELLDLLLHYFSCTHKTLDFLNILEHWLNGAAGISWRLARVKTALRDFKSDKTKTGYGRERLQRVLNDFGEASDAVVVQQLYAKLEAVLDEQARLHERLLAKRHEVDVRNMRRLNLYRKVSTVMLAAVYVVLLVVCAVVTAVVPPLAGVPQIAAVVEIASMNPMEHAGKWMDYMWGKYEDRLRRRSELVSVLMEARSGITVEDLEEIRGVVMGLRDKFQRFSVDAGAAVALRKDPVIKSLVEDMEKKIDGFSKGVKDLQTKKDKCYKDVVNARAKIFGTTFGTK